MEGQKARSGSKGGEGGFCNFRSVLGHSIVCKFPVPRQGAKGFVKIELGRGSHLAEPDAGGKAFVAIFVGNWQKGIIVAARKKGLCKDVEPAFSKSSRYSGARISPRGGTSNVRGDFAVDG